MQVQPYLFYEGRCQEALDFYKKAIGAEVVFLMQYKDAPPSGNPDQCGGGESKAPQMPPDAVMHCTVQVGSSQFMASDGSCSGKPNFQGVSLSLTCDSPEQAEKLFASLGVGGQVQMPLTQTFFSPRFGMVADKFGVSWMIYVKQQ
jgi:PhnB protein